MKNIFRLLPFIILVNCSCKLLHRESEIDERMVFCKTVESANPENKDPRNPDPILTKTCTWGNYQTVSTGTPDYKGRYSYEYQLFSIKERQTKPVKNTFLFNKKIEQLEKLINQRLKKEYNEDSKDVPECFDGREYAYTPINNMGISFNDSNQVEFNVSYGLGSACFNVDVATVTLKFSEIDEYLR